ncbi:MAG: rRNA maturation RNase YbeY [Deltaproteobacteria bacterium]|nr:MAG: rRNA maturation RNase YbeY [Deltaproteobacteria bacterium]
MTRGDPAVGVSMRGRRAPALAARLGRSARRLLRALDLRHGELSLLLVSDGEMRRLNRRWRGRDRPTDVLAFAQAEGPGGAPDGMLGDVVISVDTARRQAAERGETLGREAERLLVHGVLHLLGYDHERSTAEARRMQRRERALARVLGVTAPRR